MSACRPLLLLVSGLCLIIQQVSAQQSSEEVQPWAPSNGVAREEFISYFGMSQEVFTQCSLLAKLYRAQVAEILSLPVPDTLSESCKFYDIIFTPNQLMAKMDSIVNMTSPARRRKKRKVVDFQKNVRYKWVGTIQYKVVGPFNSSDVAVIHAAVASWEANTCVRFQEIPINQPPTRTILVFTSDGVGCYSYVGRINFGSTFDQIINLQPGCTFYLGTVVHEIGHALGLYHEQSRPDRDTFVQILQSNIAGPSVSNFEREIDSVTLGVPYDQGSVMHYGSKDFSDNGLDTIRTRDPMFQQTIGQRFHLSFFDAKVANLEYCADTCSGSTLRCLYRGYPDPNDCSRCKCPDGFGGRLCNDILEGTSEGCEPLSQVISVGSSVTEQCVQSGNRDGPTGAYANRDIKCNWWLRAPAGCNISLQFVGAFGLFLPSNIPQCFHWVEIRYKKDLSLRGPRFCGTSLPPTTFISEGSDVMLTFRTPYVSDQLPDSIRQGFRLCFNILNPSCLSDQETTTTSTTTTTTTTTPTTTTTSPTTTTMPTTTTTTPTTTTTTPTTTTTTPTTTTTTPTTTTTTPTTTAPPACKRSYTLQVNTQQFNGVPYGGVTSLVTCQSRCDNDVSCVSIDWNRRQMPFAGFRCWKHTSNGERGRRQGVDHYTKGECESNITTTTPTTTTTTTTTTPTTTTTTGSTTTTCSVPYLISPNTKLPRGSPNPAVSTRATCEATCDTIPSCIGYDWDRALPYFFNTRCWLHNTVGALVHTTEQVDHYRRNTDCEDTTATVKECTYVIKLDMNQHFGTPQPNISNQPECEDLCTDQVACAGFDYDRRTPPYFGIRCWIHSEKKVTADMHGVDNYIKEDRNCGPGCTESFALTEDTHQPGGLPHPTVTSLDACREVCIQATGCVGFDYDSYPGVFGCYTFTTLGTLRPLHLVNHYQRQGCTST